MSDFIDLTETNTRLITTGIPWFDEILDRALVDYTEAVHMLSAMPASLLLQFSGGVANGIQSTDPGFAREMHECLSTERGRSTEVQLAELGVKCLLRLNLMEQRTVKRIMSSSINGGISIAS